MKFKEEARTGAQKTVQPLEVGAVTSVEPEFTTVEGAIRFTGGAIGRTQLFRGIRENWFRSFILRHAGNQSGRRVIHLASLREFLQKHMEAQAQS